MIDVALLWRGPDQNLEEACPSCSKRLHRLGLITIMMEFMASDDNKVVIYKLAEGHTLEECKRVLKGSHLRKAVDRG